MISGMFPNVLINNCSGNCHVGMRAHSLYLGFALIYRLTGMRSTFILFTYIASLLFCSCRKENRLDCFKANGPDKSELRKPGIFNEVEVFDKLDLLVKNGPEHGVEIIGGKNILKNIKTEVR